MRVQSGYERIVISDEFRKARLRLYRMRALETKRLIFVRLKIHQAKVSLDFFYNKSGLLIKKLIQVANLGDLLGKVSNSLLIAPLLFAEFVFGTMLEIQKDKRTKGG